MPKVSVLMPAYNAEQYISEAIQSILDQSFTDYEFIIIDDCSTDTTWEIIQHYASLDTRIKAVRNEQNLKISKTRNKLLGLAQGEYIAWLDADDKMTLDRLSLQVQFLNKNLLVGVVGGAIEFFDNLSGSKWIRRYLLNDNDLRKKIFQQSPVSQGASMFRSSIIKQVGLFDESLRQAEDLDMSFRVGQHSQFANLDVVVLYCRYHKESVSAKTIKVNIRDSLLVRDRYQKSNKYSWSYVDSLAYYFTYFSQFLPAKFILKLFELLRG